MRNRLQRRQTKSHLRDRANHQFLLLVYAYRHLPQRNWLGAPRLLNLIGWKKFQSMERERERSLRRMEREKEKEQHKMTMGKKECILRHRQCRRGRKQNRNLQQNRRTCLNLPICPLRVLLPNQLKSRNNKRMICTPIRQSPLQNR